MQHLSEIALFINSQNVKALKKYLLKKILLAFNSISRILTKLLVDILLIYVQDESEWSKWVPTFPYPLHVVHVINQASYLAYTWQRNQKTSSFPCVDNMATRQNQRMSRAAPKVRSLYVSHLWLIVHQYSLKIPNIYLT